MPRYDYECEEGHVFELKQSFSSEPKADCPVCGKPSTRQFSVVPIVFKGSGWYVNDYGKNSSTTKSPATNDSSSESSTESSSKSETKSETKSEKAESTSTTPSTTTSDSKAD